jgi:paraquat-inducible protein A
MLAGAPGEALAIIRECRDCGLRQDLPSLHFGEAALCSRCGAVLRRTARHSVDFARLNAVVAAALFFIGLGLPLFELRILGRLSTSTLLSGPEMLRAHGLPLLAAVVLLTLIAMPAVKLALELTGLFGARAQHHGRWLQWSFGWLERASPWAMVEVFLLGALVAYTRLRALAVVDVGPALFALAGVMLCTVATDATLDREAVWRALDQTTAAIHRVRYWRASSASSGAVGLIGCDACEWVVRAHEGDRCGRCRHTLRRRKPNSVQRTWALLIGAVLLYIPANVLPVMTVTRLGRSESPTIIHGVGELAHGDMWPLALLVLLASVVVPLVKLGSLAAMLVMTHRGSEAYLRGRTRLFRFVKLIGRWSMLDIFALAILVGVVRLGSIATVLPGQGAAAFCAVVILTMLATEVFDSRLMWDTSGRERECSDGKVLYP